MPKSRLDREVCAAETLQRDMASDAAVHQHNNAVFIQRIARGNLGKTEVQKIREEVEFARREVERAAVVAYHNTLVASEKTDADKNRVAYLGDAMIKSRAEFDVHLKRASGWFERNIFRTHPLTPEIRAERKMLLQEARAQGTKLAPKEARRLAVELVTAKQMAKVEKEHIKIWRSGYDTGVRKVLGITHTDPLTDKDYLAVAKLKRVESEGGGI